MPRQEEAGCEKQRNTVEMRNHLSTIRRRSKSLGNFCTRWTKLWGRGRPWCSEGPRVACDGQRGLAVPTAPGEAPSAVLRALNPNLGHPLQSTCPSSPHAPTPTQAANTSGQGQEPGAPWPRWVSHQHHEVVPCWACQALPHVTPVLSSKLIKIYIFKKKLWDREIQS